MAIRLEGSGNSIRRSRIALVIGVVLVAVGLVLIAWAFVSYEGTRARAISVVPDLICPPNGTDNVGLWILMKFSHWYDGELAFSLSWAPTLSPYQEGYNLGFVLMNQSWFDEFKETGSPYTVILADHHDCLTEFRLRTTGNYYLVLLNMGPIDREYNVTITYRVTGLHLEPFASGLVVLLLACPVLVRSGLWKRKRGLVPVPKPPN